MPVKDAAEVFALGPQYVSELRRRARKEGSPGLVKPLGRPPKLTRWQVEQARRWAGEGWTQEQIAVRLDIHRPQIGLLIARRGAGCRG